MLGPSHISAVVLELQHFRGPLWTAVNRLNFPVHQVCCVYGMKTRRCDGLRSNSIGRYQHVLQKIVRISEVSSVGHVYLGPAAV
jgi:hypothetical protein